MLGWTVRIDNMHRDVQPVHERLRAARAADEGVPATIGLPAQRTGARGAGTLAGADGILEKDMMQD